jgi:folate-dependent phosphoribosylglycinamide formyltransferase PurN
MRSRAKGRRPDLGQRHQHGRAALCQPRGGLPLRDRAGRHQQPRRGGLRLAEAEGVPTFALPHKGMARAITMRRWTRRSAQRARNTSRWRATCASSLPGFVGGWEGRMVNIHPSLLPKYTGLHTHERALEAGDSHGGCTVHLVTAELDDGPVLGQTPVAILPGDTADSLAARVLIAEHQLYSRCLAALVSRECIVRNGCWNRYENWRWPCPRSKRTRIARRARVARRRQERQVLRPLQRPAPRRAAHRAAGQDQRAGRTGRADRKRRPTTISARPITARAAGSA